MDKVVNFTVNNNVLVTLKRFGRLGFYLLGVEKVGEC
jgi:hypothetical protein